jgi:predicted membrane protein
MEVEVNPNLLILILIVIFSIWEIINIIYSGLSIFTIIGIIIFPWITYRTRKHKKLFKSDMIALLILFGISMIAIYLFYWIANFVR